jgi:CBS domain-containing protein
MCGDGRSARFFMRYARRTILAAKGDNIVCIEPTADLAAAAKLLSTPRIGALVVLDGDGREPVDDRPEPVSLEHGGPPPYPTTTIKLRTHTVPGASAYPCSARD